MKKKGRNWRRPESGIRLAASARKSAGTMRHKQERRAKDARRDETRQEW